MTKSMVLGDVRILSAGLDSNSHIYVVVVVVVIYISRSQGGGIGIHAAFQGTVVPRCKPLEKRSDTRNGNTETAQLSWQQAATKPKESKKTH